MRKTWSSSKCWCTTAFSLRALARSVPNGFSMITRRQAGRLGGRQARLTEVLDDRLVDAGRDGQVVQHALGAVDLVELRLDAAGTARHRSNSPAT